MNWLGGFINIVAILHTIVTSHTHLVVFQHICMNPAITRISFVQNQFCATALVQTPHGYLTGPGLGWTSPQKYG